MALVMGHGELLADIEFGQFPPLKGYLSGTLHGIYTAASTIWGKTGLASEIWEYYYGMSGVGWLGMRCGIVRWA